MADVKAVATKKMTITVDDGSVIVPIENMHGEEIGRFSFRPTDVGMVKRYNEAAEKFDKVLEPLENTSINPDGTAEDSMDVEAIEALAEAEKRLYDLCDYIFGGEMSKAFFGKMNPFSPVGGRFYCENAIENLGAFISAQFDTETAKVSKRVAEYTAKYSKKGSKK